MKKRIISLLSCFVFFAAMAGCGTGNIPAVKNINREAQTAKPAETLIAENSSYRLEWDEETMGVVLTELSTGLKWSTTPESSHGEQLDEFGMPIKKHARVNSVLMVTYLNYATNTQDTILSYSGAVENGRVRCAKGDNSLLVEFYFDEVEFMIPVEYILLDDSVQIRIDPKKIQESENHVINISLAPFWCAAENNAEDSYLFIPSGSGALMDTSSISQQGLTYSSQVYGHDYSVDRTSLTSIREGVRLPVFGARISTDKATLAVIDSGADSAYIEAQVGSTSVGYTAVYATFAVRGVNSKMMDYFSWSKMTTTVSDQMINTPVSIRFFTLSGRNANYSGMAEIYRNYLIDNQKMTATESEKLLTVNLVGGSMVTKSFLGIPYKTLLSLTTIKQAEKIVSDIYEMTGFPMNVNLKGFGASGVNIDKIGGGYKIGNRVESTKDLKALDTALNEISSDLYMDFELTRFSSSSNGFSTYSDVCYNIGKQKAFQYLFDVAVRGTKKDTLYYFLKPQLIDESVAKLLKKTSDWSIDGFALESLSAMSYSDYSDNTSSDYYSKSGFSNAIQTAFQNISQNSKKIMAYNANVYAAVGADIIIDAPTSSDNETAFMVDIPFYEMIFKGYVPLSTTSLNLSDNSRELLLKAVETGCGISFTVIDHWDNKLIDADYPYFYNSVYSDVSDSITDSVKRMSDYYHKISGAHIVSHSIIQSGVRLTVFDNEVQVYVNYNDEPVLSPVGEIPPLDFVVLEQSQ